MEGNRFIRTLYYLWIIGQLFDKTSQVCTSIAAPDLLVRIPYMVVSDKMVLT